MVPNPGRQILKSMKEEDQEFKASLEYTLAGDVAQLVDCSSGMSTDQGLSSSAT